MREIHIACKIVHVFGIYATVFPYTKENVKAGKY
jgi:hypothetical protein